MQSDTLLTARYFDPDLAPAPRRSLPIPAVRWSGRRFCRLPASAIVEVLGAGALERELLRSPSMSESRMLYGRPIRPAVLAAESSIAATPRSELSDALRELAADLSALLRTLEERENADGARDRLFRYDGIEHARFRRRAVDAVKVFEGGALPTPSAVLELTLDLRESKFGLDADFQGKLDAIIGRMVALRKGLEVELQGRWNQRQPKVEQAIDELGRSVPGVDDAWRELETAQSNRDYAVAEAMLKPYGRFWDHSNSGAAPWPREAVMIQRALADIARQIERDYGPTTHLAGVAAAMSGKVDPLELIARTMAEAFDPDTLVAKLRSELGLSLAEARQLVIGLTELGEAARNAASAADRAEFREFAAGVRFNAARFAEEAKALLRDTQDLAGSGEALEKKYRRLQTFWEDVGVVEADLYGDILHRTGMTIRRWKSEETDALLAGMRSVLQTIAEILRDRGTPAFESEKILAPAKEERS